MQALAALLDARLILVRTGTCALLAVCSACTPPSSDDQAKPLKPVVTTSERPPHPAEPEPGAQWAYSQDEDQMTGKVSHFAGVRSTNEVEFDFPYNGPQRGQLTIRQHPRFGNDVIVGIEKGQLLCPSYEGCTVLVRFDDGQPESFRASAPADHSSETIFVKNYDRFVSRMRRAARVRVSPRVYQQGDVVFSFDVSGFDADKFRGSASRGK